MKKSALVQSIIIVTFFLIGFYIKRILPESITSQVYTPLWWVLFTILCVLILHGWRNILSSLGLNQKIVSGFGMAFLWTLPMLIGFIVIGKLNFEITPMKLISGTLFAAFFEELFFRGFLFGQLFKFAKWGFIPAALINAAIFGSAHLYQGHSFGETLGVFAVTLMGGAWFAWLYIEWETLWLPMGLHLFMNLYWLVFDISGTALGGWGANLFRVATIALSVIFTIRYAKKRGRFNVNQNNLLWQHVSR